MITLGPGTIIVLSQTGSASFWTMPDGSYSGSVKGATAYRPGHLGLEQTLLVHRAWRQTEGGIIVGKRPTEGEA